MEFNSADVAACTGILSGILFSHVIQYNRRRSQLHTQHHRNLTRISLETGLTVAVTGLVIRSAKEDSVIALGAILFGMTVLSSTVLGGIFIKPKGTVVKVNMADSIHH